MGPTWVLSAPDGPHVGPLNLAFREVCIWQLSPHLPVVTSVQYAKWFKGSNLYFDMLVMKKLTNEAFLSTTCGLIDNWWEDRECWQLWLLLWVPLFFGFDFLIPNLWSDSGVWWICHSTKETICLVIEDGMKGCQNDIFQYFYQPEWIHFYSSDQTMNKTCCLRWEIFCISYIDDLVQDCHKLLHKTAERYCSLVLSHQN